MTGFFSTCAAPHHYRLQIRTGSGHHELIRPNKYRPRSLIKCCSTARGKAREDYYQVLGVTVHSTPQEIKEAYRRLQKQRHPDIAGYKGYDYSLLLNEAYEVLMRNSSRNAGALRGSCAPEAPVGMKARKLKQKSRPRQGTMQGRISDGSVTSPLNTLDEGEGSHGQTTWQTVLA